MTTVHEPGTPASAAHALRCGPAVPAQVFEAIRRRMVLEHCKWDPQVEDQGTLAPFPLLLRTESWEELARGAEEMAGELIAMEREILARPQLLKELGMPARLRSVLGRGGVMTPAAARVMRFDFHPTIDGWRVSEVNSDVPGGYSEASSFTRCMADVCGHPPAGDPAEALLGTLMSRRDGIGPVVLLAAAGFMEDQEVTAYLARRLEAEGVPALTATINQLRWDQGRVIVGSGPASAVVRFYQGEWLGRGCPGWENLLAGGRTPVTNPAAALVGESKRLPAVWDRLKSPTTAWRRWLPETRDPRTVPWQKDEGWILKTAYSNNGDTVCMRREMKPLQWRRAALQAWLMPGTWIAQRQFETSAVQSPWGPLRPCIGVYVIEGKAAGAYARLARGNVTDFRAIDAALLLEDEP